MGAQNLSFLGSNLGSTLLPGARQKRQVLVNSGERGGGRRGIRTPDPLGVNEEGEPVSPRQTVRSLPRYSVSVHVDLPRSWGVSGERSDFATDGARLAMPEAAWIWLSGLLPGLVGGGALVYLWMNGRG